MSLNLSISGVRRAGCGKSAPLFRAWQCTRQGCRTKSRLLELITAATLFSGLMCSGGFCSAGRSRPARGKFGARGDHSIRWRESTPFPEATTDYAAGALDGKLVIAGGTYWEGSKGHWIRKRFSARTYGFDPVDQSWERLPDLPTPLGGAASAVVENKLFVLGGYTGKTVSRTIYVLAEKKGRYSWSVFGTLPVHRVFAGAVSVGKQIFLLGGARQYEPLDASGTCCTSKTATNTFMELDTAHPQNGWVQLPSVPGPRRWLFSTVTDMKAIWVFAGRFQENPRAPVRNYSLVFRYDMASAHWQQVQSLPRQAPNALPPSPVDAGGRIILVSDVRDVWQLDPVSGTYTDLSPLPDAVAVDKFVWLKRRIVGSGGESEIEGPRRRSGRTFVGQFGAE
jgi:Galactose oxidase, central domain